MDRIQITSRQKSFWRNVQKKYCHIFRLNFRSEGSTKGFLHEDRPIKKDTVSTFIENAYSVLEGAAMTNSNIMIIEHHNIVIRKDHLMMDNQVKLVTGGKTGHEPLFLSYVGPGMLTAAVVGSDISPPSSSDIFLCLTELSYNHNAGIIAIVPNSFEEVVNFGLGIEKARCNGILVDMVKIGDDCWESGKLRFGRRCLAGITLAFKIAGAMADEKKSMKDIYLTLRKLSMGTISCHISTTAFIGTDLDAGTGIYLPTNNVCEVIKKMLDYLVDPKKYFALPVDSSSLYLLLINSYTSERLFLYTCVKEVLEQLLYREITIVRVYAGTFVSGKRGFSITLLNTERSIALLRYADTACCCQFWPRNDAKGVPLIVKGPSLPAEYQLQNIFYSKGPHISKRELIDIPLIFTCKALISSEKELNRLDVNHSFGTSLIPAIEAITKKLSDRDFPKYHPFNLLTLIGYICQDYIANIHGTFLYIFFLGAAQAFLSYSIEVAVTCKMWIEALIRGIDSIKAYTQITENDFTLLYVLAPFTSTLKFYLENIQDDFDQMLEDALKITDRLVKDTYNEESPEKKKGMPEVSSQAALISLTAIVEGTRFVLNKKSDSSCEDTDENSSESSREANKDSDY